MSTDVGLPDQGSLKRLVSGHPDKRGGPTKFASKGLMALTFWRYHLLNGGLCCPANLGPLCRHQNELLAVKIRGRQPRSLLAF